MTRTWEWSCPAAPPVLGRRRRPPRHSSSCPPYFPTSCMTPNVTPHSPSPSRALSATCQHAAEQEPPRDPPLTSAPQDARAYPPIRHLRRQAGAPPAGRRAAATPTPRCPSTRHGRRDTSPARQCHDAPYLPTVADSPSTAVPGRYTDDAPAVVSPLPPGHLTRHHITPPGGHPPPPPREAINRAPGSLRPPHHHPSL